MQLKISLFLVVMLFFVSCQKSIITVPAEHAQNSGIPEGYLYYLPKTEFTVSFDIISSQTRGGKLSNYDYLINAPVNNNQSKEIQSIIIKNLQVKATATPDYEKAYIIKSENGKALDITSTFSFLDYSLGSDNCEVPLITNQDHIDLSFRKSQKDQEANKTQSTINPYIENQLSKLIENTNTLIKELNAPLNSPSEENDKEEPDSLVMAKFNEVEHEIYSFKAAINDLIEKYNTYKGEDVAEKAKVYADVIHKLIQLKTEIAGGKSDIDYPQTEIHEMVSALDQMIKIYVNPFENVDSLSTTRKMLDVSPGEESLVFKYGVQLSNNFHIEESLDDAKYPYLLEISFTPQGKVPKAKPHFDKDRKYEGIFYNLPMTAEMVIKLTDQKKGETYILGKANVPLPQLSPVAFYPLKDFSKVNINPLTGYLDLIPIE